MRGGSPADDAICASEVGRAAGSADAASSTRPAAAATDPGYQCIAGAFGRARGCGCARARGAKAVAGNHCGQKGRPPAIDARASLIVLAAQLQALHTMIGSIEKRLMVQHRANEASKRLQSIHGIGMIGASAIAATVTDPKVFRSGRDFAAWIGLVPRQASTGGKQKLGPISKQGDRYLRRI